MKPLMFKADMPKQRLTEVILNLDKVKSVMHFFDDKNLEYVTVVWDDNTEDTLSGITAKNIWIAANENVGGRRN